MVSSTDSQNSSDPATKPTSTQIHVPQNFVDLMEATAYDVIMKPRVRQQKSQDYKVCQFELQNMIVGTHTATDRCDLIVTFSYTCCLRTVLRIL